MKCIIKSVVVFSLFAIFGTSVQAGAERHKFIKKQRKIYTPTGKQGRGIASTTSRRSLKNKRSTKKRSRRKTRRRRLTKKSRFATPLTLRFEPKKFLKMVPTEQKIYLRQYKKIALSMEHKQRPGTVMTDPLQLQKYFFRRFWLDSATAGTLINYGCVQDDSLVSNSNFDSTKCYTTRLPESYEADDSVLQSDNGSGNPFVPNCPRGQGPCALYFGLNGNGQAFCGVGNSTPSCETAANLFNEMDGNDKAQENLRRQLSFCSDQKQQGVIIANNRCGLLLTDIKQQTDSISKHCQAGSRGENTAPCVKAVQAIARIENANPSQPDLNLANTPLAEAVEGEGGTQEGSGSYDAESCRLAVLESAARDRENKNMEGVGDELQTLIFRAYSAAKLDKTGTEEKYRREGKTEAWIQKTMRKNAMDLLNQLELALKEPVPKKRTRGPRRARNPLLPSASERPKIEAEVAFLRKRFKELGQDESRDLSLATDRWKTIIETARVGCETIPNFHYIGEDGRSYPPTTPQLLDRFGACKRPVPSNLKNFSADERDALNMFKEFDNRYDRNDPSQAGDPLDEFSENQSKHFKAATGLSPKEFRSRFCNSTSTDDFRERVANSGKFYGFVKKEDETRTLKSRSGRKPDSYAKGKGRGVQAQLYFERCVEESIDKYEDNPAKSYQAKKKCGINDIPDLRFLHSPPDNAPYVFLKKNPTEQGTSCYVLKGTEKTVQGTRLLMTRYPLDNSEGEQKVDRTEMLKYQNPEEFGGEWTTVSYTCQNDDVLRSYDDKLQEGISQ